jgi:hypothetical protein
MEQGRVEREELQAAIKARAELGPDLEPQLVESFVERIERRLSERGHANVPARQDGREGSFVLAVVSLVLAVPLSAIGVTQAGLVGLLVVWAGIALVNIVYNR